MSAAGSSKRRSRHPEVLLHIDRKSDKYLVDQVCEAIIEKVADGTWPPGSRLPSIRQLGQSNRISTITVANAYNRLVAEARLEAVRAKGFFISAPKKDRPPIATKQEEIPVDVHWLLQRVYQFSEYNIPAGSGWLPAPLLYTDGIKHAMAMMAKKNGNIFAGYGNPLGYLPLRRQMQTLLAKASLEVGEDQIILTHGASQALDITFRALLKRGDTLFVDDPFYGNIFQPLLAMGVNIIGVPRTINGPDVEILGRLLAKHQPVAFLTSSALQNPTGTTSSPSVLHRILQLAERHDFLIIEDEIFCDLQPRKQINMATLDQLRRVIYIYSFSKIISPTLRVGLMVAPEKLIDRMTLHKMASTLTSSTILERIVYQVLLDGQFRYHLSKLHDKLKEYQDCVSRRLLNLGFELFCRPEGGMFLWAALGNNLAQKISAQQLTTLAAKTGILLAPGRLFSVTQSESNWFRFNVAYSDNDTLEEFLRGQS